MKKIGNHKTLNMGQKVQLIRWMLENKELCDQPIHPLTLEASNAIAIDLSESSVYLIRSEVYPEMKKSKAKYNINAFIRLFDRLEARISAIEKVVRINSRPEEE